jgi:predicted dehydrogenase
MSADLKIGLIGAGFIAETHAVSFTRYLKSARLVAVAGGSRAKGLAQKYNLTNFENIADMLDGDHVDAVIITSPHRYHNDHGQLCGAAGKHVLMEKPMSTSVESCNNLTEVFDQNNLRMMIAFTQRYRESNFRAKQIIDSGKLGEISMISEWGLVSGGMASYPAWQNTAENLGTLFGYGIHNLDKLRWFLDCEAVSVSGQIQENEKGVEVNSMGIFQFANGAMANLWTGAGLPKPGFENASYRSYVVGTEGMMDVDGYGALRLCPIGGAWETLFTQAPVDWRGDGAFQLARMASFNSQNQEFIDSILENRTPAVSGVDGIASVKMALGLYEAARMKSVIQL